MSRPNIVSNTASDSPLRPWRHGDACVIVHFRLTPKSSKDSIDGLVATAEGPAFQARVRALPEDGKANAALRRLVSDWLGVPQSRIDLASGARSRLKSYRIAGDPAEIEMWLNERVQSLTNGHA